MLSQTLGLLKSEENRTDIRKSPSEAEAGNKHVCIYTHIIHRSVLYTHTYAHAQIHTPTYWYTHICTGAHTCVNAHTYMHTYTHLRIGMHMCTHVHTHIVNMYNTHQEGSEYYKFCLRKGIWQLAPG